MAASGYRFRFRTSAAPLWLAAAGSLGTAAIGTVLAAGGIANEEPAPPLRAALLAAGAVLVATAFFVLRRALFDCNDCRVGEAGLYLGGLLGERHVPWADVDRFEVEGRSVRISYRAGRTLREAWIAAPRGAETELFRVQIFAREQTRKNGAVSSPGAPRPPMSAG
jgi:hypothetical protein